MLFLWSRILVCQLAEDVPHHAEEVGYSADEDDESKSAESMVDSQDSINGVVLFHLVFSLLRVRENVVFHVALETLLHSSHEGVGG